MQQDLGLDQEILSQLNQFFFLFI